jgi:hypothetical protein
MAKSLSFQGQTRLAVGKLAVCSALLTSLNGGVTWLFQTNALHPFSASVSSVANVAETFASIVTHN